jgi:hypothetical protein
MLEAVDDQMMVQRRRKADVMTKPGCSNLNCLGLNQC